MAEGLNEVKGWMELDLEAWKLTISEAEKRSLIREYEYLMRFMKGQYRGQLKVEKLRRALAKRYGLLQLETDSETDFDSDSSVLFYWPFQYL
jgi:hypothetical protein